MFRKSTDTVAEAERRLAEIEQAARSAAEESAAALDALAIAVADGDQRAAATARERCERADRLAAELAAALLHAQRRVDEARARVEQEQREAARRRAQELTKRRLDAASAVDAALGALAAAVAQHARVGAELAPALRAASLDEMAMLLARRQSDALQRAVWAAGHELGAALQLHRPTATHWRRLAEYERSTLQVPGRLPERPAPDETDAATAA
ncbi:MAG: hypothetical protein OZ948_15470 [Deltaproteobacteria bacterium]|nr:hypothetical protein [Deltaproteobacteria bacterium]